MFFDTHTHTKFSCDCSKIPEDGIISAIEKGLSGIAITDHSDLRLFEKFDIPTELPASARETQRLKEKYGDKIIISNGIEISDAAIPHFADRLEEALHFYDYDLILASVHIADYKGKWVEFSSDDFSKTDFHQLEEMMDIYFDYMLKSVYNNQFSILCHVTYPLRYINGVYKRGITLDRYQNKIEDIFKVIIDKNTCLEINTAKCTKENPDNFCPEKELIEFYLSLGGKMFTLASDSHIAGSEGRCFEEASCLLKSHGINGAYYFEKQKPVFYNF